MAQLGNTKVFGNLDVTGQMSTTTPLILREDLATEGGQIYLQKPVTTSLSGDVAIDINSNSLRIFEMGGTYRGISVDLTGCASPSTLIHSGNIGSQSVSNATNVTGVAATLGYSAANRTISYTDIGGPQVMGSTTNAAMLSFHRAGAWAINFGLDTDNVLKVGGWSMGAVAYAIMHAGNIGSQSVNYATTSGTAASANALGGYGADTAATANAIVRRTADGYIYATYFNSNRGDEASGAASYIYDTGDGWMRKKSLTNARNEICTNAQVNLVSAFTAGSTSVGFTWYNGTTAAAGKYNGGTSFDVAGTTRINYTGYFYASGLRYGNGGSSSGSDRNLKENIADLDNNFILKLRPVKFNYIRDDDKKLQYGLIAQEVKEVVPENSALVKEPYDEDPYYYLEYTQLIAPLIDLAQKQQKQINALEERLSTLEAKLNSID